MLLNGPYHPPDCKIGQTLRCMRLGDVVVTGKHHGWPLTVEPPRPGPNGSVEVPILTGPLVKAVCEESIKAICEHWEVPNRLVRRWREAVTGRTKNVTTALALLRNTPAFRSRWY